MYKYAYITFIVGTNLTYLNGLFVLSKSLKDVESKYPLIVVMPKNVSKDIIEKVNKYSLGREIIFMDDIGVSSSISDEKYKYWEATFFRLNVARLIQYDKVVLIGTDMLVLKNIDDIFNYPHLSGVMSAHIVQPSWNMPNGDLLIIEPSIDYYNKLISNFKLIKTKNAISGGDQQIFHSTMEGWPLRDDLHIPEEYNEYYGCAGKLAKTLPNGWKDIKVLHYWGKNKPWHFSHYEYFKLRINNIFHHRRDKNKALRLYFNYLKCLKKNKLYLIK